MPGTQGEDEAMRETTALRIGAGLDAVTVSGLTGDERAEVIESWARCGVEAVEPPARADAHRGDARTGGRRPGRQHGSPTYEVGVDGVVDAGASPP